MIHIVRPGEHLAGIAHQHGLRDWRPIWDHPENAGLRELRQNPNALFPGDRVFVPTAEPKQESGDTEQRHRFRLTGRPLALRIAIQDVRAEPIAGADCTLRVAASEHELVTDGDGRIAQEIRTTDADGVLGVPDHDLLVPIRIGFLDPVAEPSGQRARLHNLGYLLGPVDESEEDELRMAVEEFQCEHGLVVDGDCGPRTQAKLEEVHGC